MSQDSFSIVIPTAYRPRYMDALLGDLADQDASVPFEVVVIDDSPEGLTAPLVRDHPAAAKIELRCEPRAGPRGLNSARNTGVAVTNGSVVILLDDDVRLGPGWLAAYARGVAAAPDAGCYGGPVEPNIEPGGPRICGRERFPITAVDHGPADRDVDLVYGANMAVRRTAVEAIGGFAEELGTSQGDEVDWILRLRASGGRVRYIAGARVLHTRFAEDISARGLMSGAWTRGRQRLAFDDRWGDRKPLTRVLESGTRSAGHALVHRCWAAATYGVEHYSYAYHALGRSRNRSRAARGRA